MTKMTSKKGITKDIDLDIDAICAYEEEHPEWSLFDFLSTKMKKPRFTDLNLLVRFLGYADFKEWVADGFDFQDVAGAIQGSEYLGFTVSAIPVDANVTE